MTYNEKYPDECLKHFLAMFQEEPSSEAFWNHASMAYSIEGREYIEELLDEMNLIHQNNDWPLLIDLAKSGDKNFSVDDFLLMRKEVEIFLKEQ